MFSKEIIFIVVDQAFFWHKDTNMYRVSQKKRSFRISKPLGPTDASGDNSVGKGCWRDVG